MGVFVKFVCISFQFNETFARINEPRRAYSAVCRHLNTIREVHRRTAKCNSTKKRIQLLFIHTQMLWEICLDHMIAKLYQKWDCITWSLGFPLIDWIPFRSHNRHKNPNDDWDLGPGHILRNFHQDQSMRVAGVKVTRFGFHFYDVNLRLIHQNGFRYNCIHFNWSPVPCRYWHLKIVSLAVCIEPHSQAHSHHMKWKTIYSC